MPRPGNQSAYNLMADSSTFPDLEGPLREQTWSRELADQKLAQVKAARRGRDNDELNVIARAPRYESPRAVRSVQKNGSRPADTVLNEAVAQSASLAATQSYRRFWDAALEGLEDLNLAFFGAGTIVLGIPLLLLYLGRLILGNFMGGMGMFSFRGISIPRVPGFDWLFGSYHSIKVVLITVITAAYLSAILLVAFLVTNPSAVPQLGFCLNFGWVLDMFNAGGVCNIK